MYLCRPLRLCAVTLVTVNVGVGLGAQSSTGFPATHSSPARHVKQPLVSSELDAGDVLNGVYLNKALGMSCKIPAGWVLRSDEMNERDQAQGGEGAAATPDHPPAAKSTGSEENSRPAPDVTAKAGCPRNCNKVLLAAFSRPPEARGEDVNASIVIAAENVDAYPGLKEAAQYFGPLTEVASAQGFTVDEEPYEFALGTKKLVRGDFHKDVGTRVMRQSTLVWLAHGYALSITVIGGTEDEVEGLIDGVSFAK